jgi:hypothetical protein
MTRVKAVPILPAAKVAGILHFTLGAVAACAGMIGVVIFSTDSPVVTLAALLVLPFGAGILGFLGTALACWLYNQIAGWGVGALVEFEEAPAAGQAIREEAEIAGPEAELREPIEPRMAAVPRADLRPVGVYRIKLSAAAREASKSGSLAPDELGAEWADLRNQGARAARTAGISLYHLNYPEAGGKSEFRWVANLPDCTLQPGEVLRIHAGQPRPLSLLKAEDRAGAHWHSFTGHDDLMWNDTQGDTVTLYEAEEKETLDSASFAPNPQYGAVLERDGNRLALAKVAAAGGR